MAVDRLTATDEFHNFLDESLRENACRAVDTFLEKHEPVDNTQLHGIPGVVKAAGLGGLRKLVDKQKSKNTKKKNQEFWGFLHELIFATPGPEYSIRHYAVTIAGDLIKDESGGSEKKEQKRIRKENKAIVEDIVARLLPTYFEHFNCHYFYKRNIK